MIGLLFCRVRPSQSRIRLIKLGYLLLAVLLSFLGLLLSIHQNLCDTFLSQLGFLRQFRIPLVLQSLIEARKIKRIRPRNRVSLKPELKFSFLVATNIHLLSIRVRWKVVGESNQITG